MFGKKGSGLKIALTALFFTRSMGYFLHSPYSQKFIKPQDNYICAVEIEKSESAIVSSI
jgi:hypothetical protein